VHDLRDHEAHSGLLRHQGSAGERAKNEATVSLVTSQPRLAPGASHAVESVRGFRCGVIEDGFRRLGRGHAVIGGWCPVAVSW
jgi:hypothetical protein